jgi:hypothetical protein
MREMDQSRIRYAVGRTSTTIDDLRTSLPFFNEKEWHDDVGAIIQLAQSFLDFHSQSNNSEIVDDYFCLIGALMQIEIPNSEELSENDRFRRLRGQLGNLRSDADLIINTSIKAGVIPINLDSDYFSQLFINKNSNIEDIKEVSNSILQISGIIDEKIVPVKNELSEDKYIVVNNYINSIKKNVNTIKITISIGEGIDLAVIERAGLAMKASTEDVIRRVKPWVGEASAAFRRGIKMIGKPVERMVNLVKSIFQKNKTSLGSDNLIPSSGNEIDEAGQELSAGMRLRIARNKKKMSLDQISTRTRIPIQHLRNIEESNYSLLPSPVYVIGYSRQFAQMVGENSTEIARLIKKDLRYRLTSPIIVQD